MPRILCLGMSALDAIYRVPAIPTTPTKVLATEFVECGGGMAANASVAVARLGGQAHYWGRVGDDALGTRILDQLVAEGIDVSSARRIPGCASPSAAILVDDRGERLVCAYNDPKLDPDPSWLPLARIAEFQAVLGDVRWPQGTAAVFDAAARQRIPRVLDGDIGPREALIDLAKRATHAVFSEPGLAYASGRSGPGDGLAEIARCVGGIVGVTLAACFTGF
jgi:sulfofructose kinase